VLAAEAAGLEHTEDLAAKGAGTRRGEGAAEVGVSCR
jgi:hypothetical protein